MNLGGDPQDLRDLARRIRTWADSVDDDAANVFKVTGVEWESTAATGFADMLKAKHKDTGEVAVSMREAAEKLDDLANTLEDRQQTLNNLLAAAGKTIEDAEEMVRDGATDLLDGAKSLADDAKDLLNKGKSALGTVTGGLL